VTILGLRYRPGPYRPVAAWRRWWPLARHEFLSLFRTKGGIAVFCVCFVPLAVRLFVLMIRFGVVDFGPRPRGQALARSQALAQWDPQRPDFYVEMVVGTWPGLPILVLLTAMVTAGAVARDRRTNALELLWTRGIGPRAYLFAKWCGSLLLVSCVTVVGPLLLWCAAALMAEDWGQLTGTLPFLGPMLGGLLLVTAAWTGICVQVSTLCSQTSQAVVAWCMLVVGSTAIAGVLGIVARDPSIRTWLSIWDAGATVARSVAGVAARGSPGYGALFLAGVFVALWCVARRRLVLEEAVG